MTQDVRLSDKRAYLKGIVGGVGVGQRVGIEEIITKGRYAALSSSSSENAIAVGDQFYVLDHSPENFLPGDDILMTALADLDCYQWGRILAKDTTAEPGRLRIFVDEPSDKTGTFSNWELMVAARPKDKLLPFQMVGLRVVGRAPLGARLWISSGSVRDFTDTVDLPFDDDGTSWDLENDWDGGGAVPGLCVSASLAGTITTAGNAGTGTGTDFLNNFGDPGTAANRASLEDFRMQCAFANIVGGAIDSDLRPIIRSGAVTTALTDVASATALTTASNLGATDAAYTRGGKATFGAPALDYAIVLARNDSTGVSRPFACSFKNNSSGAAAPDLPAGYTYYRVIAYVQTVAGLGSPPAIYQPIALYGGTDAKNIRYDNAASGLAADNDQDAIDELAAEKADAADFDSGTYIPTLTNGANVAASTAYTLQWMRKGKVVTLGGRVDIDCVAAAGTASILGISLPPSAPSDFTSLIQAGGTCAAGDGNFECGAVRPNIAGNRLELSWASQTANNHGVHFSCTYLIVP